MAYPTILTVNDGSGSGAYYVGNYVNISANSKYGYTFREWVGSGVSFVNRFASSTSIRLDSNPSCSATAQYDADPPPPTYTLSYSAGANGSISGNTNQTGLHYNDSGTEVTAVPDAGYVFVSWSDSLLTAARTDTVQGNESYTATFASAFTSAVSISCGPYYIL